MKDSVSEKITANEVMNNGRQVHLYYDPTMGEYQTYGYSAYNAEVAVEEIMKNDALGKSESRVCDEAVSALTRFCLLLLLRFRGVSVYLRN